MVAIGEWYFLPKILGTRKHLKCSYKNVQKKFVQPRHYHIQYPFHTRWRTNHLDDKLSDGLVDYCESRLSRLALFIFRSFLRSLLPSATLTFQENFPKFIASIDSSILAWQANYPYVRLNMNLGRTLDDLFICRDVQIVFERSSTYTNKQTDKLRPVSRLKFCLSRFHAHQTICPSETIFPSRRFVRVLVWKRDNAV